MATTTTTTSRVLRAACAVARSIRCGHCAAPAGQACVIRAGREGYHLARFARARALELIAERDLAAALMAADPVFTPASVVTGGGS